VAGLGHEVKEDGGFVKLDWHILFSASIWPEIGSAFYGRHVLELVNLFLEFVDSLSQSLYLSLSLSLHTSLCHALHLFPGNLLNS
jgi:hypothetical protein